jgi:hypothetical protein
VIKLKRILLTIVLISIIAGSSMVNAAVSAITVTPTLTFSGTTAHCSVSIIEIGKNIEATLELWQGTTLVDSWSSSATSYLVISKNHSAISGLSYTLKVSGTIDGVPFLGNSVVKVC